MGKVYVLMPVWEGAWAGLTGVASSWTRTDYPFADPLVMNSGMPWPEDMEFPHQRLEDKSVRPELHQVEFYAQCLAFSPEAFPIVEPFLNQYGEFHSLIVEDQEFKLFNAFYVEGQSSNPFDLNPECFTQSHVFRVLRVPGRSLLCAYSSPNDPDKNLIATYERLGWSGLTYREIWPAVPEQLPYI